MSMSWSFGLVGGMGDVVVQAARVRRSELTIVPCGEALHCMKAKGFSRRRTGLGENCHDMSTRYAFPTEHVEIFVCGVTCCNMRYTKWCAVFRR